MTPGPPVIHRSTADWLLDPHCLLDPTRFVSAPSSLSHTPGADCDALLDHPNTIDIPQGTIFFALYPCQGGITEIIFRIGPSDPPWMWLADYYYVQVYHDDTYGPGLDGVNYYRYEFGSIPLDSWAHNPIPGQWNYYYFAWVNTCNLPNPKSLHVELHHIVHPDDILVGQHDDPLNKWADRGINRVGLYLQNTAFEIAHNLDDFVLWQFHASD